MSEWCHFDRHVPAGGEDLNMDLLGGATYRFILLILWEYIVKSQENWMKNEKKYSRTSMAQTPLELWKLVWDRGSGSSS